MGLIGKKNIVFGFFYLVMTLSLGFYMAFQMYASGQRDDWLSSPAHQLIKQAHVHGNLEALLNIVAGLILCLFGNASPRLAQTASVLLILAALLHSGLFYLGGLGLQAVVRGAFVGPILLILSMGIMAIICWRAIDQVDFVQQSMSGLKDN